MPKCEVTLYGQRTERRYYTATVEVDAANPRSAELQAQELDDDLIEWHQQEPRDGDTEVMTITSAEAALTEE